MADGASGDRAAEVVDSIRARTLVIVDEAGIARARLGVMADGACRFALLDSDGFERIGLTAGFEVGTIDLAPRTRFDHGTRVRLYAHDPADGAEYAVGVQLVVRGDVVAGFEVVEGQPPHVWPT
jgi:hypothetical protein